jgi:hypothetical protein
MAVDLRSGTANDQAPSVDHCSLQFDARKVMSVKRERGRVLLTITDTDRLGDSLIVCTTLSPEDVRSLREHLLRREPVTRGGAKLRADPFGLVIELEQGTRSLHQGLFEHHIPPIAEMLRVAMIPTAEEAAEAAREEAEARARREQAAREAAKKAEADRQRHEQWLAEYNAKLAQQRAEAEARYKRAEQEKIDTELQRQDEWRKKHASHLRVPPASVPDNEPDGFPVGGSYWEQVAIVPVVPRLAIYAGGRPTVISGGPEVMKSFVCCEIALSVGLGDSYGFGGAVPIKQHGHVVHLDWENPGAHRTTQRYRRLAGDGEDVLDGGVLLANGVLGWVDVRSPTMFLDDPNAEESLIELLYGAVLCIVDSLQFACRHQSEKYSAILAMLGRVSATTGCAIIVILHPVKGWERRQGLDRLDFVTGREFDTALWLDKDARQITTFTSIKNANGAGPIEPLRVRLVDQGGIDPVTGLSERIRFEAVASAPERRVTSPAERVRRRILRALADGPLSGRQVREEVTGGNDAIVSELSVMRAEGVIILDDEDRYVLPQRGPSRSVDAPAISEKHNEIMVRSFSGSELEIGGPPDPKNTNGCAVLRGPDRSVDGVVRGPLPPKGEGRVLTPKKKKGAA